MMSFQKTSCKFLVQFTTVVMLIIVTGNKVNAQSMGISSSAITPDVSSILEMRTSTKGLLMPRLTTTERDAIASPATGLIIYNTTASKFNFYNGSTWITMFSGSSVVNSVTGTSNRITIGGTAADPTVDISSGYVGQSSITTLGTIGSGVWNGTTIGIGYGGTGATTQQAAINALTGTQSSGTFLRSNGTNASLSAIQVSDVPTLNQNTTGSAATLTTTRSIHGGSFNGSADVTNIIASTYGGTGNGFTKFTGATTSEKTYTLPNASATILTDNAAVTVAQGGTGSGTIAGARVNLGLDKTTIGGNANYSILAADKTVVTGTTFTAPRTWTLPDASTVNAGYEIIISDFLQTITSSNTLTIAVQSGQKLNGTTDGTEVIGAAGAWRRLISDGVSNWTFDAGIVRLTSTQTLTNKTLTSPTLTNPVLGVASSTSSTVTGTGGNGFLSLAAQSSNPSAPASGTLIFSNSISRLSWRSSANTFVKTFDAGSATADRTYTLPDANGTIPVSASGNIALSAAGNISFTGTLPIANGGTNSSATPTNGGVVYGDGTSYQVTSAGTTGQILQSTGAGAPTWVNGGTMLLSGVSNNSTVNNTTLYFPLTGGIAGNATDAQAGLRTLVSRAGTVRNLYVVISAALGSGKTGTVTVMKNGVATSLVATLSVGPVSFNDVTNSFTVVAGDEIGIRVVTTGNVKFSWACDFSF